MSGSRKASRFAAPQRRTLIDAVLLFALIATALSGLGATFTGRSYLLVGLLGAGLSILTVLLARALRWPSVAAALLTLVWFFGLGPVLCLRSQEMGLPGPASARYLVDEVLFGWKDLLTTLPPVDGSSGLLVLPWAMGLVAGAIGMSLAHLRTERVAVGAMVPLMAPVAVLALVILLGVRHPQALWLQGAVFAVLALAWLAFRFESAASPLLGTQSKRTRLISSAVLLGLAGGLALPVGTWAAGTDDQRLILRSKVDPPFDVGKYPSPLASFHRYVQLPEGKTDPLNLHREALFTIEGVPVGTRVRFATLDRYDGVVWGASNNAYPGAADDTYQRVSSTIDNPIEGQLIDARVTVGPGFSGVWLPTVGALQSLTFESEDHIALADSFRYNLATSGAVVPTGIKPGDVYTFTAVLPDDGLGPNDAPYAVIGDAAEAAAFLDTQAVQWSNGETAPMARVFAVAARLRTDGKYSDGVVATEQIYHPGHNRFRLTDDQGGVNSEFPVGNDEQYAAWMALFANRIGVPARVVLGAIVPNGGDVTGADVQAWVELQLADGTWHTLATDQFMDDDKPAEQQTTRQQDMSGSQVPPPAPIPPPSTTGEQNDADMKVRKKKSSTKRETDDEIATVVNRWVGRLGRYVGIPLGLVALALAAIAGAKAVRRRRRRTRGPTSTRVVGGWRELVDHARDLGHPVPVGAGVTRKEQSLVLASEGAPGLARRADGLVFGPSMPQIEVTESFWGAINAERKRLSGSVSRWRRLRAVFDPSSLTPMR